MSSSVAHTIPRNDFAKYLIGRWKRNLQWRYFGAGFQHLSGSDSIVLIEEETDAAVEPGNTFLNWKFSKGAIRSVASGEILGEDAKLAFSMQVIRNSDGTSRMEWDYRGHICEGFFHPQAATATLLFREDSGVITAIYRAIDANSMAVCIIEADNQYTPVMQYGMMIRL